MADLPLPVFFDTDASTIMAEMLAYYEQLTGKKLSPAQAETLLINAFAYREKMIRVAANEAAKQNLLAFASYPALDYLGELVGVKRLPASSALCTIAFTLVTGHPALTIPTGVRVQTGDGKVVFKTLASINVQTGESVVTAIAEATTPGVAGNNYNPGDVSIILDPQAFVSVAANTDVTAGGADDEADEPLRERIRLAPNSFSTAGPIDAYVYFAKSAHPAIIDVSITSPEPGDVNIYPLLEGGVAPSQEIIDAVLAKCNADDVRPLNDNVTVAAPAAVSYALTVQLTVLKDAIDEAIIEQVTKNLTAYAQKRQTKLGIDVVIDQIKTECVKVDGVYKADVIAPSATIVISESQFANCTAISVTISGEVDN